MLALFALGLSRLAPRFLEELLRQQAQQAQPDETQSFEFQGWPADVRPNIGKKFSFLKETKVCSYCFCQSLHDS